MQDSKENCENFEYILECIKRMENLEGNISQEKSVHDSNSGKNLPINTITSFTLGIVSSALLFDIKLILKGIEQPLASVIERINPILEYPRHLVLTEDTQEIFNNKKIFSKIYKNNQNKMNVPNSKNFSIYFTSTDSLNGRLSEAFRSRCTIINCPNYDTENYLTMKLDSKNNYKDIANYILLSQNNANKIVEEIIKLFDSYNKHL